MKKLTRFIAVIAAVLAVALPANAQFRWGIKAGVNINSLNFSSADAALDDLRSGSNRSGFTGGLTADFTIPVIGLGFDASLMYVHRSTLVSNEENSVQSSDVAKRDYLEIPINLKYKLGLPVIGKFVTPYIATGPSFAFLCSKKDINNAWKNRTFDASWNIGLGVLLVNHLQVGASYGIGMTKTLEFLGEAKAANVGRTNSWTVTAAYLF